MPHCIDRFPSIKVTCHNCNETYDEREITDEDVGIESNEFGQDVLSFICPRCGKQTTSLRRG